MKQSKFNKRPMSFVLTASDFGCMLVNRHDYHPQEPNKGVGIELLNTSHFSPYEVSVLKQLVDLQRKNHGDNVVVLDCGANIGTHTVQLAKHMHNWGKVFAFEPQERVFYALAGNITLNNCSNAHAYHVALGDKEGFINIPVADHNLPACFGSLEMLKTDNNAYIGQDVSYSKGTCKTRLMTIDSMSLKRVDFIKMDVEGMEMYALEGARNTIKNLRPAIFIERMKTDENKIKDFLLPLGYITYPFGINLLTTHKSDTAMLKIMEKLSYE